ncbi:hypothetical protein GBA65_14445 [Rubrobacter marinus]|uniref:Uncharacterized protein n=1 Tax=Rubrobacter marinus TaxID=2653852 RepID=A0A6G8PZ76_9ACTN|nr:hypothetical protein [Rubrobacter marinus]QIN79521.1 hypothetical protein GBA65_14445 [Rubrobacter marinus]
MRSALFWLAGASLAFFATAGAFLVLANFGTAPKASDPIPRSEPSGGTPRGPELALSFSEEGLGGLERSRNQTLTLYLENRGEEELRSVELELAVSSEDTAYPRVRRYDETVTRLAPGEVEAIDLTVDLSRPRRWGRRGPRRGGRRRPGDPGGPGLRARRAPVVETAVVSP